ncbi:unnamed protein product [Nippostrongylus brasiliensis]|uniref:Coiled-coil domain-containing protein 130 n=1 Tax=Nippostrongylus brasiliensis TaxID=27835 RepID=A0A0N4YE47_NIPBR|nr:unnamed protein product [Nippostrongylus brasiliensis]
MGERKGQNFYYPPDFDYKKHKSLNKYHGTHALRERAKKISQGILVIRFEMPFNIWCLGCNNHVGMGVRYNAEKKKIGMYYTTPLYEFRMKCHLCDNYYVIRTDPKLEGAKTGAHVASTITFQKNRRTGMAKAKQKNFDSNLGNRKCYKDLSPCTASHTVVEMLKIVTDETGKVAQEGEQQERRGEAAARRIFPSTSSKEPLPSSSTSSVERLKVSMRKNRDRRINDNFEFNPPPKKSSLSLGIVKKRVKQEQQDEHEDEIVFRESRIRFIFGTHLAKSGDLYRMSQRKINSVCVSNYNADLNRIEELEADIRFMQRRIQKMRLQVRQKVAKRVEVGVLDNKSNVYCLI